MKTKPKKIKIYKLIQDWLAKNYGGEANDPCYDMKALANHIEKHLAQTNEPKNFKDAARPLMIFLADNYHPHCSSFVTSTSAQLLEDQECFTTQEFVKDQRP